MEDHTTTIDLDMTNDETIHEQITAEAVAFIDEWLDEHGWFVDARTIDFALDLRHLLSSAKSDVHDDELQVTEPV